MAARYSTPPSAQRKSRRRSAARCSGKVTWVGGRLRAGGGAGSHGHAARVTWAAVRDILGAAFARARGLGLTIEEVDDALAGPDFEFQAGASGNFPAGLGGGFIFGQAGGIHSLGNLAGGKFGQGGEDEFGLASPC